MANVEQRQIEKRVKLEVSFPEIFMGYKRYINGVGNHDWLKTTFELDGRSRFWYYVRIFIDLMDSISINAHINYKKELNVRINLLDFKIIFA